jgi:hypothetical protein
MLQQSLGAVVGPVLLLRFRRKNTRTSALSRKWQRKPEVYSETAYQIPSELTIVCWSNLTVS